MAGASEYGLGQTNNAWGLRIVAEANESWLGLANMQAGAKEYGLGLTNRYWPLELRIGDGANEKGLGSG